MMEAQRTVVLDFFKAQELKTTDDLKPDTAYKFLAWRGETNYSGRQTQISASTMKHNLRHTFAVNKLLSQTATLQMVSYQLGHSDISTTANLYGKFVSEHFKAGFEEAIRERRELVEWLEGGYF
jgi:integrase